MQQITEEQYNDLGEIEKEHFEATRDDPVMSSIEKALLDGSFTCFDDLEYSLARLIM